MYWRNKEEFFLPWYLIRFSCSFCRIPVPALTHPSSDGRPSSKHHPGNLSLPRSSGCHYPLKNPIAVQYVDTHQSLKTTGLPTQDPHQLPLFLLSPWKVIVPFHCPETRLSLFKPTETKHVCLPYFTKMALREIVDGAKAKGEFSVITSLNHSEVFQNCEPSLFSVSLAPRTPADGFSSHVTMVSLLSSFAHFSPFFPSVSIWVF